MVCPKINPFNGNWYVALLGATVLKILRAWVFTSDTSGFEPDSTYCGVLDKLFYLLSLDFLIYKMVIIMLNLGSLWGSTKSWV